MAEKEPLLQHIDKFQTSPSTEQGSIQEKSEYCPAALLLSLKGHTVRTLIHSRICLVGAHQNLVQGAIVLRVAMVCALVHCAFDGTVRGTIAAAHGSSSFSMFISIGSVDKISAYLSGRLFGYMEQFANPIGFVPVPFSPNFKPEILSTHW